MALIHTIIFFLHLVFQYNIPIISTVPDSLFENANDIILSDETLIDVEAKDKIIKTKKLKVLVLNNQSIYTTFGLPYDNIKSIQKIKIEVQDENGKKIETIRKRDFKDYPYSGYSLYTDQRYLVSDFEKFSFPYILNIEYETKEKGALIYAIYRPQSFHQSVFNSQIKIRFPAHLTPRYQLLNGAPEPESNSVGNKNQLVWTYKNLSAINSEPMCPYSYQYFPTVKLYPNEFYYDGYEGSMENWNTFNDFYYNLNKDRDILSNEMREEIQFLTKDLNSEFQVIDVLYQYLKDNMRYVSVQLGIGGYQTFDAAYVEKNKYGDCKALSNFMNAILKEVGIESNKVLIYRGNSHFKPVKNDFVEMAFNHAMVYVPSQEIYIECTSNNYPLGYLGHDNANKKVIVSTPDKAIIQWTPEMDQNDNKKHSFTTIKLLEGGGANINSRTSYKGYRHDYLRYRLHSYTKKENEEWFQKSIPVSISQLKELSIEMVKDRPELELIYDLKLGKLASGAGNRIFFPINPIDANNFIPEKCENRRLSFHSDIEETIENEITIIIPDGYEIEAIPENDFNKETEYGNFRFSIKEEGGKIKVYKKYISKNFEFPPEKYEDYRNTMKEFSQLDNAKVVLVKKKT